MGTVFLVLAGFGVGVGVGAVAALAFIQRAISRIAATLAAEEVPEELLSEAHEWVANPTEENWAAVCTILAVTPGGDKLTLALMREAFEGDDFDGVAARVTLANTAASNISSKLVNEYDVAVEDAQKTNFHAARDQLLWLVANENRDWS